MAELTAKHLQAAKIRRLAISNRTWENGLELATRLEATAVHWKDFRGLLEEVDIVVGSTGAPFSCSRAGKWRRRCSRARADPFLDRYRHAARHRALGPRARPSVSVHDRRSSGIVQENISRRQSEMEAAARLIHMKAAEFERWLSDLANGIQPTFRHSLNTSTSRLQANDGSFRAKESLSRNLTAL